MRERDRIMKELRALGLSKQEAQESTYTQLAALFPPLTESEILEKAEAERKLEAERAREASEAGGVDVAGEPAAVSGQDQPPARAHSSDSSVVGLDAIPDDWPELPANASLAAEIQWCQSNRLHCVRESGNVATVDLSRALAPAPSWSALGWLETSIRTYSKFIDVAAKISSTLEDDRETAKRERMAIDEIRKLLGEMLI